jgi:hypothetical protein
MFIGHFAVALAAKRVAPRLSLGTTFLAAQLVDLVWPVFLLVGLEHVRIDPGNTAFTPLDFYDYPITHSLDGSLGWSCVLGAAYWLVRRGAFEAVVVGACVASHWVLDLIAHRPDLPIIPGMDMRAGLGLWNSVTGTMLVELSLFAGATFLYLRATRPSGRKGSYALWGLLGLLLVIWLGAVFGPPPPDETTIAISALSLWLFVLWGYWVDRNRQP